MELQVDTPRPMVVFVDIQYHARKIALKSCAVARQVSYLPASTAFELKYYL